MPMSFNRWNYGYNNPVMYTDPTGFYGYDVHTGLTYRLVKSSPYAAIIDANESGLGVAFDIAKSNQNVDIEYNYFVKAKWCASYPDCPSDNSAYHFVDLLTARTMMKIAVTLHDKAIFGIVLHALQDTYAHHREGYTTISHFYDTVGGKYRRAIWYIQDDFFYGGHWEGTGENRRFIPSPFPAHSRGIIRMNVQGANLTNNDLMTLYLRYNASDISDIQKETKKLERAYFGFDPDEYIEGSTRDTLMYAESKIWIDRFLFNYMFNLCDNATQN